MGQLPIISRKKDGKKETGTAINQIRRKKREREYNETTLPSHKIMLCQSSGKQAEIVAAAIKSRQVKLVEGKGWKTWRTDIS
jgi:Fe2+ or Zn2+ uptake regulation protein